MRSHFALFPACFLTLILAAGCGDNNPVDPDASQPDAEAPADAAPPDAEVIDAFVCPAPAPGAIGGVCTDDAECDSASGAGDGLCIDQTDEGPVRWPAEGFCTHFCTGDADCGAGNFCATDNGTLPFCMPSCCEGDVCPTGRLCSSRLAFFPPFLDNACVPGTAEAVDGDPCNGFFDCNENSFCLDDNFEQPNGFCHTVDCTLGDDSTCAAGGDGHCVDRGEGFTICLDACTDDTDCRMADGYRCVDGTANGLGLFCDHPKVGDTCAVNTDCGNDPPWVCRTGAAFPGGYCTAENCTVGAGATCSRTSTCHDPDAATPGDEFCVTLCDAADPTSCRAGYICLAGAGQNEAGDPQAGCVPAP